MDNILYFSGFILTYESPNASIELSNFRNSCFINVMFGKLGLLYKSVLNKGNKIFDL